MAESGKNSLGEPRGWLRAHIVKLILAALITASAVAYLTGVFDKIIGDVLPKGAEISCALRELVADHWPFRQPEAPPDIYRVLIATLAGDDEAGTQTQAVMSALQGEKAIDVVSTCRVLEIQGAGLTAEAAARKTGLEWLARRKADVLIFGEVLPKREALNLYFLPVGGTGDFHQHAFELKSGFLKGDFSKAAAGQLQAVALASVKPATEESGKYLVEILRPVGIRLEQLIRFPPSGLSARQLADIQFALGLALSTIGDQAGDNKALTEAVAAYRAALEERTRDRVPLDWAQTQNNLGIALWTLGERESGTRRLEDPCWPIARR
jgi:hypothetical protein